MHCVLCESLGAMANPVKELSDTRFMKKAD